MFQVKPEKL